MFIDSLFSIFLTLTCVFSVFFFFVYFLKELFKKAKRIIGLPGWLSGKKSACQCRECKRHGCDPWVGKIPWRRKWQLTPVFLPGEFHGQSSLAGYSPRGRKESDKTEGLSTHTHTHTHTHTQRTTIYPHFLTLLSLRNFTNFTNRTSLTEFRTLFTLPPQGHLLCTQCQSSTLFWVSCASFPCIALYHYYIHKYP